MQNKSNEVDLLDVEDEPKSDHDDDEEEEEVNVTMPVLPDYCQITPKLLVLNIKCWKWMSVLALTTVVTSQ